MEVRHSLTSFTDFTNPYLLVYKLLCSLLLFFYNLKLFINGLLDYIRQNLRPNLCYSRWYSPFLCSKFMKFIAQRK